MSSLSITAVIFGCTFGGTLLGMALRAWIPQHHLSADTKETVTLATGIVGTMTAILLGLLVASAKESFDVQRAGVAHLAADFIVLDRTLAHYGEETRPTRELLRTSLADLIQRTWPAENKPAGPDAAQAGAAGSGKASSGMASSGTEGRYEAVAEQLLALVPKTDAQRSLHTQALKVAFEAGEARWLLYSQRERSVPDPLLMVMVFWLAISFASLGLFAPRNPTAVVALIACALAIASAMYLILELDRPFQGMIQISRAPMHKALDQLGR